MLTIGHLLLKLNNMINSDDDICCSQCGGELDTGYECNDCGYDMYGEIFCTDFITNPSFIDDVEYLKNLFSDVISDFEY